MEDCYTCVCGLVIQCNCKHLRYLKQKLNRIDVEQLNTIWDIKDIHKTRNRNDRGLWDIGLVCGDAPMF